MLSLRGVLSSLCVISCETYLLAHFQIACPHLGLALTSAPGGGKSAPRFLWPARRITQHCDFPKGSANYKSNPMPVTDLRQRFQPSLQCQATPIPRVDWVLPH